MASLDSDSTRDRYTEIIACEQLEENVMFSTMMLDINYFYGLVSVAMHTKENTIRPALQLVKTSTIPLWSLLFSLCFYRIRYLYTQIEQSIQAQRPNNLVKLLPKVPTRLLRLLINGSFCRWAVERFFKGLKSWSGADGKEDDRMVGN